MTFGYGKLINNKSKFVFWFCFFRNGLSIFQTPLKRFSKPSNPVFKSFSIFLPVGYFDHSVSLQTYKKVVPEYIVWSIDLNHPLQIHIDLDQVEGLRSNLNIDTELITTSPSRLVLLNSTYWVPFIKRGVW